ncbi:penicillin-binding protein 2 [Catenovulum sp. SM1970]|uniref:penicillin-binding protein 2 n=1 Tax=Marinifaba aquimaris TaxID=2741323 RepID=UPI0015736E00|nr:penicillin-binding protein 2 [Marinifaba aquimaris]NTS78417.1 penicillin-binding protein 2 [Marinifaba aquimaris]
MWVKRRVAIRDHAAEANLFTRRASIALVGVLFLLFLLLYKAYKLQVEQFSDFQTQADGNRIKVQAVAPNRGLISDRNGKLLAVNKPVYNLDIIAEEVDDMDVLIEEIGQLINLEERHIKRFRRDLRGTSRFNPVTLKTRLSEQEAAVISVHQHKFPGVIIDAVLKRNYPYQETLTHAVGYVAKINPKDKAKLEAEEKTANYKATKDIGKLGLERYYEELLHGQVGYRRVEVNNRGRVIRELEMEEPIPGENLILHLDLELQQMAQQLLEGHRGSIVVLDAQSNGIFTLYSNPSYDANLFVHGISSKNYRALLNSKDKPLINRATQGRYAPASTVKPHIALLGLDEQLVTAETRMRDPGFYQIKGIDHKYRDWKKYGHGWVDVYKAIEESCDTYFYDLALRLGIDKISEKMNRFGFGEQTGIDIFEETGAVMPSQGWKRARWRQPWYAGDTISIGIGQGYWTATPLQIALSTSVLANRGQFFEPKLLAAMQHPNGEIERVPEQDRPPLVLKDDSHWQTIIDAMDNTLNKENGTAYKAFKDAKYRAAGKTGTAQIISIAQDAEYDADAIDERFRDNALFVAFAPIEKPEIVVAVIMENVGGGSSNAAPVARKLMDHYFDHKKPSAFHQADMEYKLANNKDIEIEGLLTSQVTAD